MIAGNATIYSLSRLRERRTFNALNQLYIFYVRLPVYVLCNYFCRKRSIPLD